MKRHYNTNDHALTDLYYHGDEYDYEEICHVCKTFCTLTHEAEHNGQPIGICDDCAKRSQTIHVSFDGDTDVLNVGFVAHWTTCDGMAAREPLRAESIDVVAEEVADLFGTPADLVTIDTAVMADMAHAATRLIEAEEVDHWILREKAVIATLSPSWQSALFDLLRDEWLYENDKPDTLSEYYLQDRLAHEYPGYQLTSIDDMMEHVERDGHVPIPTDIANEATRVDGVVMWHKRKQCHVVAFRFPRVLESSHRARWVSSDLRPINKYALVRVCCSCSRMLDDEIPLHGPVMLTHGMCDACGIKEYGDMWQAVISKMGGDE